MRRGRCDGGDPGIFRHDAGAKKVIRITDDDCSLEVVLFHQPSSFGEVLPRFCGDRFGKNVAALNPRVFGGTATDFGFWDEPVMAEPARENELRSEPLFPKVDRVPDAACKCGRRLAPPHCRAENDDDIRLLRIVTAADIHDAAHDGGAPSQNDDERPAERTCGAAKRMRFGGHCHG